MIKEIVTELAIVYPVVILGFMWAINKAEERETFNDAALGWIPTEEIERAAYKSLIYKGLFKFFVVVSAILFLIHKI